MFIRADINVDAVAAALTKFGFVLGYRAESAAETTASESHQRITRSAYWTNRTGKLAKSFGSGPRKVGRAHYRVSSNSPVATFIDQGTRPHDIRPVRAKMLRFVQNGAVRFSHGVHHPGTKAVGFEATEQSVSAPVLERRLEQAVVDAKALSGL